MNYADLPPCTDFRAVRNAEYYTDVPADWWVVITDVVNSTGAIAAGQYREVNTLGIGSIVCVQRVLGSQVFPFAFGGDGATMLVSSHERDAVLAALAGLQYLAQENFGLGLRVGAVAVGALRDAGHGLRMARYQLVPGQAIAMFSGSGFDEADARVRNGDALGPESVPGAGGQDLGGMSCRWQPVPSQRGVVVSLIVQAREDNDDFYNDFLVELDELLEDGLDGSNPVGVEWMRYRGVLECIRDEVRYHRGMSRALLRRIAEIVLAVGIFRHGLPSLFFDARRYARALRTHTDFRKFDNGIRMTLDCTPREADAIRQLCDAAFRRGRVFYGLFESDSALMTCFLSGLDDGEHLHFVDATHGGYAEAARRLKVQRSSGSANGSGLGGC